MLPLVRDNIHGWDHNIFLNCVNTFQLWSSVVPPCVLCFWELISFCGKSRGSLTCPRIIARKILIFNLGNVIKWKYFPCYRPFVRGIHRSPVDSPHRGCDAELRCWANARDAGDLRRHGAHCDVTVMNMNLSWTFRPIWKIVIWLHTHQSVCEYYFN